MVQSYAESSEIIRTIEEQTAVEESGGRGPNQNFYMVNARTMDKTIRKQHDPRREYPRKSGMLMWLHDQNGEKDGTSLLKS